ncbi:MAG: hypothetical protein HC871_12475 [Rhizobiales bacterium]|nr:hypothetical protein [Hyphomicrobiales bacterium]
MADPIVVTQLIKKRSELAGLADAKRGELNTILRDLDHLDAVIKLFAPEKVPELLPVKRRASDRTFARHELTRRIFNILREAERPMTARQITDIIVVDKGTDVEPGQLKGRVVRALKRQEKVLESRVEERERVWWAN